MVKVSSWFAVSCLNIHAWYITGTDLVDPDDPTVIAENELLGAAKSIEAAAKKLMQLKPRATAKVEKKSDKVLGFNAFVFILKY